MNYRNLLMSVVLLVSVAVILSLLGLELKRYDNDVVEGVSNYIIYSKDGE